MATTISRSSNSSLPTVHEIAREWDKNVADRAAEFEDGIDETYEQCIVPTMRALLRRYAPGNDLLDVGCGLGYLTENMALAGYDVTGIDVSEASVAYAESKFSRPEFLPKSIMDFRASSDRRFDICVANMVFHNLVDLPGNLTAISQLLVENGILIASLPHPCFWLQSHNACSPSDFMYLEQCCFKIQFKIRRGQVHTSPVTYIHRSFTEYHHELQSNGFHHIETREIVDKTRARLPDLLFWIWRRSR